MCILIHLSEWKEEKVPSNQLSNADNENETYFTNITSNLQAFQLEMSKLDLIICLPIISVISILTFADSTKLY